jgi:hypothetical protein
MLPGEKKNRLWLEGESNAVAEIEWRKDSGWREKNGDWDSGQNTDVRNRYTLTLHCLLIIKQRKFKTVVGFYKNAVFFRKKGEHESIQI